MIPSYASCLIYFLRGNQFQYTGANKWQVKSSIWLSITHQFHLWFNTEIITNLNISTICLQERSKTYIERELHIQYLIGEKCSVIYWNWQYLLEKSVVWNPFSSCFWQKDVLILFWAVIGKGDMKEISRGLSSWSLPNKSRMSFASFLGNFLQT